jgi:hypothetical protein
MTVVEGSAAEFRLSVVDTVDVEAADVITTAGTIVVPAAV